MFCLTMRLAAIMRAEVRRSPRRNLPAKAMPPFNLPAKAMPPFRQYFARVRLKNWP